MELETWFGIVLILLVFSILGNISQSTYNKYLSNLLRDHKSSDKSQDEIIACQNRVIESLQKMSGTQDTLIDLQDRLIEIYKKDYKGD